MLPRKPGHRTPAQRQAAAAKAVDRAAKQLAFAARSLAGLAWEGRVFGLAEDARQVAARLKDYAAGGW